jgi:hypothetical protein
VNRTIVHSASSAAPTARLTAKVSGLTTGAKRYRSSHRSGYPELTTSRQVVFRAISYARHRL